MSVSNFESLPNEVLLHLFENHLNLTDIFIIFAHDLNRRFTSLVHQCQRFRLDLTNIRKQDFYNCLRSTLMFRRKIQSLSISNRLPGQMNMFLTYFPTFDRFQSLTKLSLEFVQFLPKSDRVNSALNSLSMTKIHTLSIKITNMLFHHRTQIPLREIFSVPTLRRLVVDLSPETVIPDEFQFPESSIEHLTFRGYYLNCRTFSKILVSAKQLVYLNCGVIDHSSLTGNINCNFEPLTTLRTFILTSDRRNCTLDFRMFIMFLTKMPNLYQLEMNSSFDGERDDAVLEIIPGLLPLLTCFTVRKLEKPGLDCSINNPMLNTIQTSVNMEQKMFNIYRAESQQSHYTKRNWYYYFPIFNPLYTRNSTEDTTQMKFIWSLPHRTFDNDLFPLTVITAIHITSSFSYSMIAYPLNHVKILRIDWIDSSLFTWIKTFINLNKVIAINAFSLKENSQFLFLLISQMNNLQMLIIDFNLFNHIQSIQLNRSMKRLDISMIEHRFKEKDIRFLANLFPSIEHLYIYTKDLHHVPLLRRVFPTLITLTFRIVDPDYQRQKSRSEWIQRFPSQVTFDYELLGDCITVWIDPDVFNDSFWHSTFKYRGSSLSRAMRQVTKKFTRS